MTEIKKKITTTYLNIQDTRKAVLRCAFIALNAYHKEAGEISY